MNTQLAIALFVALVLDRAVGEPPLKLHPVVWTGTLISKLDGQGKGRAYGFFVFFVTLAFVWGLWLLPYFALSQLKDVLASILIFALFVYLLKASFSWKLMRSYGLRIADALQAGDVERARKLASEIVRRDLTRADGSLIASAAIESIAEGEVDGLTSPIFYYPLGILGPLTQRTVNTLDSMIAYPYPPFREVGWLSAKADTVINYVPARLTSLMIALAALLLRLDWKGSLYITLRDHRKTRSLNGGWPMSAMAGALGVKLTKSGEYELGDGRLPGPQQVLLAVRVYDVSVIVFVALVFVVLLLFPLKFPLIRPLKCTAIIKKRKQEVNGKRLSNFELPVD
ncbi:MAG: cobalamin biosynthesis protein [Thermoprotei archaeon]